MKDTSKKSFEAVYQSLNIEQKAAVDNIDGPMLVIAGPGTGKTQLLSARVANILRRTDTPAQNILCLTFTETGAENMRQRLTSFIGQDAYSVNISTYHAFGGDLIRQFPEYFSETRLQNPVDELGKYRILRSIVDNMSYLNPLKSSGRYMNDLVSVISELKRAILTSDDIRSIAKDNIEFIIQASRDIRQICSNIQRFPATFAKAEPLYAEILASLTANDSSAPEVKNIIPLSRLAAQSLQSAMEEAAIVQKSTPLTTWKNSWLAKDSDNYYILSGRERNDRLLALAEVLEQYQAALDLDGLYDFDDMILRAADALQKNDDLRYTLQEQYLYVMLDEFQDTNGAQLKLVELLTNNPVSEGRPNIMAVGDDDQAIYAFQGAQYSNMIEFYNMYREVRIINLTDNYRSHSDILSTATNIATQISERLSNKFRQESTDLVAVNDKLPKSATIIRQEFLSDIAQDGFIAKKVKQLIQQGVSPRQIAVLAPKHRYLEPLVAYFNALNVPVQYEKRENILESPLIHKLLSMSRLVVAIADNNDAVADSLWAEVLSADFFAIPTGSLWEISWRVADKSANEIRSNAPVTVSWTRELHNFGGPFRQPVLLFLTLAKLVNTQTCETMLDYIIGSIEADTNDPDSPKVCSPLREYFTGKHTQSEKPLQFYEALSHLKVLRDTLREFQATQQTALSLRDFIDLVDLYEDAELKISNTSPYTQNADAVQLMTVFKAKGLEFEYVILPDCQDDVWGSGASGNNNKIALPANLAPIRHAGASEDERLRILYVAITRAKIGLILTSFTKNYTGKSTSRLKYFDEVTEADGSIESMILPARNRLVVSDDRTEPELALLELNWQQKHLNGSTDTDLHDLLAERLHRYRLSPTHLNTFLDLKYGGPQEFFFRTILRFPEAPTDGGQFGNAIHETLEWLQYQINERGKAPTNKLIVTYFIRRMESKKLAPIQLALEVEKGKHALNIYLAQRKNIFKQFDRAEVNFRNERIVLGNARLSGKIDRLEINEDTKTIVVVDYKTGESFSRWTSNAKLHKYQQQLYCYKILLENSRTYSKYKVIGGRLEFIEPNDDQQVDTLELEYKSTEETRIKQLIEVMWQHVQSLSFPDTSKYNDGIAGIRQFEDDLINGVI